MIQSSAQRHCSQTTFSLIVPVYNVEGLLRPCLDSIFGQTYDDFEVILVEDCSTDHSRRILEEYRTAPRTKIILLEKNQGLANARNVGLTQATGNYVLFIDSDDQVDRRLLSHLAELTKDNDLIVFNHFREWYYGKRRQNLRTPLLKDLSSKIIEQDDVDRKTSLFSNLNVAWNKAYRRSFLNENNISFDDGYYEDITLNYKSILLADRIAVTPFPGYFYFQRAGSILNSKSDKHKDLVTQYSRLYQFLHSKGAQEYYSSIDNIFVNHVYNVLKNQQFRLTKLARSSIVAGTCRLTEKYRIQDRLAECQSKAQLDYIRQANSPKSLLENTIRNFLLLTRANLKEIYVKKLRPIVQKLVRLVRKIVYRLFFVRLPIDKKLAVFEAYWGASYSCSPRAISEHLESTRDLKIVWFVRNPHFERDKKKFVRKGSLAYYYHLARAKYLFNNANFPDEYVKRIGSIFVQTKHGTPLKTMGYEELISKRAEKPDFDSLAKRCSNWDYVLSSNHYSSEVWRRAFPLDYEILEYGYPRNDILVKNRDNFEYQQKIRGQLGIKDNDRRQIILFAPTFREYQNVPNFYLDIDSFIESICDTYIVLQRAHYLHRESHEVENKSPSLIDVTAHPSVEQLYLVSDVMLTDYSSSMYDFSVLKRPVVLYLPDVKLYKELRGLNYDIAAQPPSVVTYTQEELVNVFLNGIFLSKEALANSTAFHNKFCSLDQGNATERVCARVFDSESV